MCLKSLVVLLQEYH